MEKTVLSPNRILQGRYRIIQLLGHGGMGAVYQAMDENLKCLVTVKETFATDSETEIRRAFEHEASLLANIRHPAFPKVTDYFEQGDGLFFVMEFIPGDDLAKELRIKGRPFPVADVLRWADMLLAALEELHAVDPPIVHKDIKPSNLKTSAKGEIFLLDFGLAKGAAGQMSTVQSQNYSRLQGHTPHFAPPEQITRTGTSPRSDLYSLAATLWCLLTSTLPPDAMLRLKDINDGLPDPLRPARELNPDVPPAVSDALYQALSLKSAKRPASAAEMRAALREAVEAPRRAQAERARLEREKGIRREGEEAGRAAAEAEFARRLKEEQAAHAASARRLKEESEHALARAKEESDRVRDELSQATQEAAACLSDALALDVELSSERKRRQSAEEALSRTAASLAEKESALSEAEGRARRLASERNLAVATDDGHRPWRRPSYRAGVLWGVVGLIVGAAVTLAALLPSNQLTPDKEARAKLDVIIGGANLQMVRIHGGTFVMGSPDSEPERDADEGPLHEVTVQDFNIGKYEVTQVQWRVVAKLPKVSTDLKEDPSAYKGDNLPVENVSWVEAVEFCARLSKATGQKYRLPTEAEWEYAARAGASGVFNADPSALAWYANNSGKQSFDATQFWRSTLDGNLYYKKIQENGCQPHPVGQKRVNAFGLYDTLGNVWEWCLDNWHSDYNGAPADGAAWDDGGNSDLRIARGGSWSQLAKGCRPADRFSRKQDEGYTDIGFRVISTP